MGQGASVEGKSYAGTNSFNNYCLCATNDIVHYFKCIPRVESIDVPSLLTFAILLYLYSNILFSYIAHNR